MGHILAVQAEHEMLGLAPAGALPVGGGAPVRHRDLLRLLRTTREIPCAQLAARALRILQRQLYSRTPGLPIRRAQRAAAGTCAADPLPSLPAALALPLDAATLTQRATALAAGRVAYLRRVADFRNGIRWRDPEASPLWAFNLHYLGSIVDLTFAGQSEVARRILTSWAGAFQSRWDPVAWHPYPTSLRLMNLCMAAAQAGSFEALGDRIPELAGVHAAYILQHLEYDLRGNHLLENACALLFAARFLRGGLAAHCEAAARRLLFTEVREQVLPDGAHFELSPMYHTIVLHRLLQVTWLLGAADSLVRGTVGPAVERMVGFLRGVLCPDGDIPLLGDSVRGFAPHPSLLFDLAARLGVPSATLPPRGIVSFHDAGLHVFHAQRLWAIFDAGPVCPPYLPGHGQADSLTVEVWCDGACVVGDPGVHEYTGPERAWGRSSRAHSTLTVDDADTSEVYGSFRVGGRAAVTGVAVEPDGVTATLEPFAPRARFSRTIRVDRTDPGALEIIDSASAPPRSRVRSRLHLHPAARIVGNPSDDRGIVVRTPSGQVRIMAQHPLWCEGGHASPQYGVIHPTTILVQELQPQHSSEVVSGRFSVAPLDS